MSKTGVQPIGNRNGQQNIKVLGTQTKRLPAAAPAAVMASGRASSLKGTKRTPSKRSMKG